MIDYERVRSTVRPEPMLFDEYSVWINTEISEIEGEQTEYEYRMIRYTKDEYIKLMAEKNAELESQLTDTQLALCDVYEMIGGE